MDELQLKPKSFAAGAIQSAYRDQVLMRCLARKIREALLRVYRNTSAAIYPVQCLALSDFCHRLRSTAQTKVTARVRYPTAPCVDFPDGPLSAKNTCLSLKRCVVDLEALVSKRVTHRFAPRSIRVRTTNLVRATETASIRCA